MTGPFRAGVRRLVAGLGVATLGLVAVLFNVQVLRADDYVVRPHLGIQADGYRRYQYNPRIADVLARDSARDGVRSKGTCRSRPVIETVARRAREAYTKGRSRRRRLCDPGPGTVLPAWGAAFHLLGDVTRPPQLDRDQHRVRRARRARSPSRVRRSRDDGQGDRGVGQIRHHDSARLSES